MNYADGGYIPIPLSRFVPKDCADGAHYCRQIEPRVWTCLLCGESRPFHDLPSGWVQ